ncbi:MAG: cupin domain-containing protein [Eubacteriales bacterium]
MELITKFDINTASAAHEGTILASGVFPMGLKAPFSHAWGYLDKPGAMDAHRHHTEEIYLFFKGEGFVVIDDGKFAVTTGDVVRIPPDALHSVINEKDAELLWAAFWWPVEAN